MTNTRFYEKGDMVVSLTTDTVTGEVTVFNTNSVWVEYVGPYTTGGKDFDDVEVLNVVLLPEENSCLITEKVTDEEGNFLKLSLIKWSDEPTTFHDDLDDTSWEEEGSVVKTVTELKL